MIFQLLDQTEYLVVGFVNIGLRLRIFCLLLDPLPLTFCKVAVGHDEFAFAYFNFNNHRCFVLALGFGDRDDSCFTLEILLGESGCLADREHIITWNIL